MVMVGVMLESQFAKSLLNFLISSISSYAEDFIIISFYGHIYGNPIPFIPFPLGRGRYFVRGAGAPL
jgi:hypothetical protein